MLNMPHDWAHKMTNLISSEILDKKSEMPKALVSSMFTHATQDINLGARPKSLGEYVTTALVQRLLSKFEVKATGSKICKEIPIRNTNVYEHTFETKDGREFYCYQFGFAPIAAVDQLASSILETSTTTGCIHCQFTGFQEEDIECSVCRNGKSRGLVRDNPNYKNFRDYGWPIFQDVIGKEYSDILKKFSEEYHDFFSDIEFYWQKAQGYMSEWQEENELGVYFSHEVEHDLFLSIGTEDDDSEGEGDQEKESSD